MSEFIIDVNKLCKSFNGRVAVRDVSLQVKRGEIFGFLGPNGSGKTTTIRMICGLLIPDSGSGRCLGFDVIKEAHKIKRQVGYMTQHFSLYADLSVQENLSFMARLYQMKKRRAAVADALDEFGLSDRKRQLAGTLSGGWKQRLALACALIHKPKLLLLDEPTAGVDPKARRDFWDHVHRLAAMGITTLVSTHYMDEAERCMRLAYIAYGDILTVGTPADIVTESKLSTWKVAGRDIAKLQSELEGLEGVQQVVAFGNVLHVSGEDPRLIKKNLAGLAEEITLQHPISPSLEDVFIHLVDQIDSA